MPHIYWILDQSIKKPKVDEKPKLQKKSKKWLIWDKQRLKYGKNVGKSGLSIDKSISC